MQKSVGRTSSESCAGPFASRTRLWHATAGRHLARISARGLEPVGPDPHVYLFDAPELAHAFARVYLLEVLRRPGMGGAIIRRPHVVPLVIAVMGEGLVLEIDPGRPPLAGAFRFHGRISAARLLGTEAVDPWIWGAFEDALAARRG